MDLKWHLILDGRQVGPVTDQAVRNLIKTGRIHKETLIWAQGMPDWLSIEAHSEFRGLFKAPPPTPRISTSAGVAQAPEMKRDDSRRPVRTMVLAGVFLVLGLFALGLSLKPYFHKSGNARHKPRRAPLGKRYKHVTIPPLAPGETWEDRLRVAVTKNDFDAVQTLIFDYWADVESVDSQRFTPLHLAARNGNYQMAVLLLSHGASPFCEAEHGKLPLDMLPANADKKLVKLLTELSGRESYPHETSLQEAAAKGDVPFAQKLSALEDFCIDCRNRSGETALTIAAQNGHKEMVLWLIQHGAQVNYLSRINRDNPLLAASGAGLKDSIGDKNREIVKILLEHGALPVARDNQETPLHIAARKCQAKLAEELLKHGAAVNVRNWRDTPLVVAKRENCPKVENLLLSYGAEKDLIYALEFNDAQVLEQALKFPDAVRTPLDHDRRMGHQALYIAATNGYLNLAKILLKHGADVNGGPCPQCGNCDTPLAQAVFSDNFELVSLLLKHGADPNHPGGTTTPLHNTLRGEKESDLSRKLTALLLEYRADPNIREEGGRTPVFYAPSGELVDMLVAAGADVNVVNKNGENPLHHAKSLSTVQSLLKHGANPNVRDKYGKTPLFYAPNAEIIDALVAAGANVNVSDEKGRTPLHQTPNSLTAQALLKHGANPNARDNHGCTPLNSPYQRDVVRLLEQYHGAPDKKCEARLAAEQDEMRRMLEDASMAGGGDPPADAPDQKKPQDIGAMPQNTPAAMGDKLCWALMEKHADAIINLTAPILLKMQLDSAQASSPDADPMFAVKQTILDGFRTADNISCSVASARETPCTKQDTINTGASESIPERCGRITMNISANDSQEPESMVRAVKINGKWYMGIQ